MHVLITKSPYYSRYCLLLCGLSRNLKNKWMHFLTFIIKRSTQCVFNIFWVQLSHVLVGADANILHDIGVSYFTLMIKLL